MSVINDVLKDLETRESRFTPIETGSVAVPVPARRHWKPLVLTGTMLILLATGVWLYLQAPQSWGILTPLKQASVNPSPVVANTPEITDARVAVVLPAQSTAPDSADSLPAPMPAAAPAEDSAVASADGANQIIGLQIRETEQEMRMQFFLRGKVVAYLSERGENSFAYHLRDTESQITAPEISDNQWIQRLAIHTAASGVDIHFVTAPGILVETRQDLIDGEAVWAISLRKSIAPPAVAENVDDSAVAPAVITPQVVIADESAQAVESVGAEPAAADETAPAEAEVRLEIKTTNPDARVANQLEYAGRLLGSGRYTDAENLLRELLGGVEDYQARRHLLAIYEGQQRRERFDRLARDSAQKYPQDIAFKTAYARSLFQGQAYRQVIELFAGQVELDARQQAMLAASYQRLDQHDNAMHHYRLALRQDAGNAKNWIGLGISQEHSAELEAALDSYQRAGKIGQLNPRLQAFVDQRSDTLRRLLN